MTNIFSYAQMVDRHPVTYDSTKEDAFIVHLPHKQHQGGRKPVLIKMTLFGLYLICYQPYLSILESF
jgi:hypothetical protein